MFQVIISYLYKGFEDSIFLINSTKWLKAQRDTYQNQLQKRYLRLFSENFDGLSVFISRYLKPQKPPLLVLNENVQSFKDDPLAIERAARFVSLIPFLDDSHGFDGMPDCWCTDEEFLTLNFGGINFP